MQDKYRSLYFDYRPYPFVRPPELDGTGPRHRVAIVGAGPVGLGLALLLARHGVPSVVIEADDSESSGSRAACISRRSMEFLQQIGVIEPFLDVALPWTDGRSYYRGKQVFHLRMPHSADERYFPMANLQQNILERILLDRARETGLVEVRWRSEAVAIERDKHEVRLGVRTPEGEYTLSAEYLVAADGARSAIRRLMGLRLSGTSYSGRYLIVDIKLPSASPTERRAWFDPPANRGSTILMHKQPHDIWRVDYQLRDDDRAEDELLPERIRTRVQEVLDMAGESAPWELDWYSIYSAHCLCLDRYVHDRVIFAGDAAHLVPIFGVRGLNSGFADAGNLGWKLAAVLGGRGNSALLESYGDERRAATLEIFREAGKSTRFMTPPSPTYKLFRDAALNLALSEPWAGDLANPRQSAPYDYVDSPLNSWQAREGEFAAGPRTGAPLRSVRTGRNETPFLTDALDIDPVALVFQDGAPFPVTVEGVRPIYVSRGAPAPNGMQIDDPDGRIATAYGASHGSVYLLRPDWHVAARAHRPDAADLASAAGRIWAP